MRYLLVKTENMPILALALGSLDYKAGNSPIFPIAFGEFSILIDKEDKTFFYVKGQKEIDKFVEDHAKIYTTNDLSHALEFLKETKMRKLISLKKIKRKSISRLFLNIL